MACPWRLAVIHDMPRSCPQDAGHDGLHGGPVVWWPDDTANAYKKGARRR